MPRKSEESESPKDPTVDAPWEELEADLSPPESSRRTKPTVAERQRARIVGAGVLADRRKTLDQAVKRAIKEITDADPAGWASYTTRVVTGVLPRSVGATRDSYRAMIQRILTPEGATSTHTEVRHFATTVAGVGDIKDWTKPLPDFVLKGLSATLAASEPPFNQILVKRSKTLSKLHQEAKRLYETHQNGGVMEIAARIVITQDTVFINGESWKINAKEKRITVSIAQLHKLKQ